ncbi:MAG: hypothetical protein EBT09_01045 [Actinobacteria bacterium]|nr:hypothetical protein [Actinomycetota bacterium]
MASYGVSVADQGLQGRSGHTNRPGRCAAPGGSGDCQNGFVHQSHGGVQTGRTIEVDTDQVGIGQIMS